MIIEKLVHVVALSSKERAEQARMCFAVGKHAEIYASYSELVGAAPAGGLVIAEDVAEWGGAAALLADIARHDFWLPVIATAPVPDPSRVVTAIKAGALDYIALPLDPDRLGETLLRVDREIEARELVERQAADARARLARLTPREREVLELLVAGASNKMIARDLRISPRTVEIHRAHMMSKLGANHTADAVRTRLEAMMGAGMWASAPLLAA